MRPSPRRSIAPRFGGRAIARLATKPTALAALGVLIALVGAGCSGEDEGAGAREAGDRGADSRPSIVLIVIESLRTDAVASYGSDPSSPLARAGRSVTPHLDALAGEGIRHANAFSDSPETVASHASLFTGLRVDRHGVGLFAEPIAPDALRTLAEALRDAGYQTAGFSENPMVGPEFGLAQGFDTFEVPGAAQLAANVRARRAAASGFDVVEAVRRWQARRDANRPSFLFVNLADPHLPLGPAAHPELLPAGTDETRVHNLLTTEDLRDLVCRKLPDPGSLAILRGLYLSRVAEADAKLGRLLELARSAGEAPLVFVTADHGTHLGERKLLGHHFDVDHRVLHVPLVVAGPGLAPGVDESPVALHRVADSIRCAAGDTQACTAGLPGPARSVAVGADANAGADARADEPIVSIHPDDRAFLPPAAAVDTGSLVGASHHGRVACDASEPVFGRAVSWIRYPMKLTWRQGGRYQLFDLSWDPAERADQLERQPEVAARLRSELDAFVAETGLEQPTRARREGTLREQAEASWEAGRQAVLASPRTEVDAVWFARLALARRSDPELEAWVARQIPLHENEPFYAILAPTDQGKPTLGDDPGRGITRWTNYLLASVAEPEPLAMRRLAEYLALETSGYILTHQLTALVWAEATGRAVPAALRAKRGPLLARIAAEHARDEAFSDLWVERAAFLAAFGDPDRETLERWVRRIVENHLGRGDWGDGASELEFDGHVRVAHHAREHLRGLAMVVLARYLEDE